MNIRLAAGRRVATAWRACALAFALLSALPLPGPANADIVTTGTRSPRRSLRS